MSIPCKPDTMAPLADPRERPEFRAEFYPSAGGQLPPEPGAPDPHDRVKLEFLGAYYAINRAQDHLAGVRTQVPGESRKQLERAALEQVECALRDRDALEDFYAPYGIIAEPVMQEGRAVDVRFTFGDVDAEGRKRNQPRFSSAFINIPLPAGLKGKALLPGETR
jgi:hypothetical protein